MKSANAAEKARHTLESKQTVFGFWMGWKVGRCYIIRIAGGVPD